MPLLSTVGSASSKGFGFLTSKELIAQPVTSVFNTSSLFTGSDGQSFSGTTFSSVNVGSSSLTTKVIVLTMVIPGGADALVSSVDVGGYSASIFSQPANLGSWQRTAIAVANAPISTANITITMNKSSVFGGGYRPVVRVSTYATDAGIVLAEEDTASSAGSTALSVSGNSLGLQYGVFYVGFVAGDPTSTISGISLDVNGLLDYNVGSSGDSKDNVGDIVISNGASPTASVTSSYSNLSGLTLYKF